MKTPNLRFRGYTEDWEEKKLGEVAEVTKLAGFEFSNYVSYSDTGNIIALRGLNIKNGQLNLDDVKYIDNSEFSKLSRSKLYTGDIVFTYVGTIGESAIISENNKYYLAPNVALIRVKDDSCHFVQQNIVRDKFKFTEINKWMTVTSQLSLSMESIRKFNIFLPSLPEQEKIGSFLSKIDERIELEEKKLELLKERKRGWMQKLFNQEIRFKDEDGNDYPDWEEKKLGEIAEKIQRGASPRPISDKRWFDDNSPIGWIRISDITKNGKYIYSVEQKLSREGIEKSRFLESDNLILSIAATIGKPVINKIPVCIHDGFIVFKNIYHSNDIEFLYYYLLFIRPKWLRYQQPGSQANLNSNLVRNQKINIPALLEQQKIAEFLSKQDELISAQEKKVSLLKEQKKGLL